jgi:hypothetical protein
MAVRVRVVGNRLGHWLTKVQAHGVLPPRVSEAGSARASEHERAAEQSTSVSGQKSAEAILAAGFLTRKAAAKGQT